MNDRQLRSFILAADLSSFSKAAEASYISTPALVQQINLLEKSAGFSLFMRQPRGVKLTAAGEQFYAAAKEMVRLYDEACRKGQAMETGEHTVLRIACPDSRFPDFFFDAIRDFSNQRPNVKLKFVETPYIQHFDVLRSGQIDLALTAEPNEAAMDQLDFVPLMQDRCAFCMRPDHQLAKHARMTPALLEGWTVLCGNYAYMNRDFKDALSQVAVHKMETEYGKGIGVRILGSDDIFVINDQWRGIYTSFLAVVSSDIPSSIIGIVTRNKSSMLVRQFIQCAREHCPQNNADQKIHSR